MIIHSINRFMSCFKSATIDLNWLILEVYNPIINAGHKDL